LRSERERERERYIYILKNRCTKTKTKTKVLAVEVDLMIRPVADIIPGKNLKLIKCLNNESTNLFPPFILFLV
jgi:hypothetical protein